VRPVKIGPGRLAIEKFKVRSLRGITSTKITKTIKKANQRTAPDSEAEAARILRLGSLILIFFIGGNKCLCPSDPRFCGDDLPELARFRLA
jgi:hypothetical protein